VKVMDFGIARALHGAQSTMTQTGMVMGTPQYLSPEQALGKAVDHRSDLYATGCLLYELLALRPPFTGETPLSVVYQHVQDIPVPPSEVSDATPPELDGLVMRSLAKEPDDRFQTAEEMRGLVQYALQMLYDQGGHTGTWNTGPVTAHEGMSTPALGLAGAAGLPHPGDSGTAQIPSPLLPPGHGGDDGGFEGHGNHGSGRGKLWILAVFAVIAIAAGVALALNGGGDGGGAGPKTTPTASETEKDTTPSEDASDEPTDEQTEEDTSTGGNSDYTPSYEPSPTYSPSPTESKPSADPTTKAPTTTPPPDEETTPPDEETPPEESPADAGGTNGDPGAED
ncbi:protein kinase, partial [Streptomyces sp. NPDC060205]|uniref:protein kinase domain-containing protein n=1 Tax=Streptomyces sp. NPDC060205 TaxID=3347072 RepID=UPI003664383C